MKHPLIGRRLLAGVLIPCVLPAAVSAQSTPLSFVPLEYGGVANPSDLDDIVIDGLLVTQGSDLFLTLRNNSVPGDGWVTSEGPTITRVYFDSNGMLGGPRIVSAIGYVVMSRDDRMVLPGGKAIGFTTDTGFNADPPPTKLGIDPGEGVVFKFLNTPLAAFTGGNGSRIGLHIQQIGDGFSDSASFVNLRVVPEPATLSLGLPGCLALMRRRRTDG